MFVAYMHCKANDEGDPAGFLTAVDWTKYITELDYLLSGSECLWIVPGTWAE